MARTVKWLRELPELRERAAGTRTETFSRRDLERLFGLGRVQTQELMKAVGSIQAVAGAHFVAREALVAFLDALVAAPEPAAAFRDRLLGAEPAPRPRGPLRLALPEALRTPMLPELPAGVRLAPGRITVEAPTAEALAESLLALALVMRHDDRWRALVEPAPAPPAVPDEELAAWLREVRGRHAGNGAEEAEAE